MSQVCYIAEIQLKWVDSFCDRNWGDELLGICCVSSFRTRRFGAYIEMYGGEVVS